MNKWISVKEKLPAENQDVLAHIKGGGMTVTIFMYRNVTREPMFILMPSCESIRDETLVVYLKNVTHWMVLPEPPEEKNRDEYRKLLEEYYS